MKARVPWLFILLVMAASMSLVNCSPYSCNVTFGSTACTPSGSGLGGGGGGVGGTGGGGGSTPAAFAFAVDQNGTLNGYTLNSSAFQVTSGYTAPGIPSGDPGVGMVIAQKQFVYTVFEVENKIYGWSMNATSGTLTLLSGFPLILSSSLGAPIVTYNEYNVATNPDGTLLFISDTANFRIFVYQISTSGALTAVTNSPFSTGLMQPGNLTADGLGKYLYVTTSAGTHQGSEVLAYAIGTGANVGVLTPVIGSPFAFPMWQLQGDPSGAFLIGTSGNTTHFSGFDDKQLYVFAIQSTGTNAGAISEVSGSPFATQFSPFNIAVEPASSGGEFVYSFSINDAGTGYNPIEGFQLSTSTGTLTGISGSPFSGVATGHWGQFDQSGALLFVYSDVLGGATSTQLSALAVSSTGVLTQPIASLTLATAGYWVVTDP